MIEILHKGNDVLVEVTAKAPVQRWVWTFKMTMENEAYARLLSTNFRENMQELLASTREEAYVQGWKDAKAKVTKETWFSSTWKTHN